MNYYKTMVEIHRKDSLNMPIKSNLFNDILLTLKLSTHKSCAMSNLDANPIPKGYEGITPHLFVSNAADAIDFTRRPLEHKKNIGIIYLMEKV